MNYLVIDRTKDKIETLPINQLLARVNEIGKKELVLGYDTHAGFNIPANAELKEFLRRLNLNVDIDLAVIDERRQSNDKPYSPTSVYAVANDKVKRRSIHPHRHMFVSEISLDKRKILDVYRELLGEAFSEYSRILEKAEGESLGDFLTQLTQLALEEGLEDLDNVRIRNSRFDRFTRVTETSHPVSYHRDHDILYLGLHKAVHDEETLDFLVNRFSSLGEKPYFIIIPVDPEPYFIVKGDPL